MTYPNKLTAEERKLPQVEKIITETIKDKQVAKQIYADGSYGVRNGDRVFRYFSDGKEQTYVNFVLREEKLPDGTKREWYDYNGQMRAEELPDGTKREWDYFNGQMRAEELPDGTKREWYDNGQMSIEKLPDGTKREWYDNGQKRAEELPDGTKREWYDNGKMSEEKLPDGTWRHCDRNGQMRAEELLDGTKREWYDNGKMSEEELPDGTWRYWYDNGQMRAEYFHNGTVTKWDECGQITLHKTRGKEDTRLYLAKRKVAENQAKKSEKMREKGVETKNADGTTRKRTTVKKLGAIEKFLQIHKALIEVDAGK